MQIQRLQPLMVATLTALAIPLAIAPPSLARPGWDGPPIMAREAEKAFRDLSKAEYEGTRAKGIGGADTTLLSLGDRLLATARQQQQSNNYFAAKETAKAAARVYEAARNLAEARTEQAFLSRSYYDAPFVVSRELSRTEAEMAYYKGTNSTIRDLYNRGRQLAQPATVSATTPPQTNGNIAYLATNRAAVQLLKAARHLMRAELGF
ncbi:putative extracytoplasmic protein [Thermosynechococcus sp. NK55a]|uniref:hypothetical protein n=1 Tax=Thermosynechococcus sp. NK55a TaxID=1394889 RepID=UPI0003D90E01|nr:hypothetical protein [Thermosynechococcus sp. NK55a]AHB88574.1 putative extracytoplasmic protein [Thermosynechococcus sp. NK55a]